MREASLASVVKAGTFSRPVWPFLPHTIRDSLILTISMREERPRDNPKGGRKGQRKREKVPEDKGGRICQTAASCGKPGSRPERHYNAFLEWLEEALVQEVPPFWAVGDV
jgi:hypothetical protein